MFYFLNSVDPFWNRSFSRPRSWEFYSSVSLQHLRNSSTDYVSVTDAVLLYQTAISVEKTDSGEFHRIQCAKRKSDDWTFPITFQLKPCWNIDCDSLKETIVICLFRHNYVIQVETISLNCPELSVNPPGCCQGSVSRCLRLKFFWDYCENFPNFSSHLSVLL